MQTGFSVHSMAKGYFSKYPGKRDIFHLLLVTVVLFKIIKIKNDAWISNESTDTHALGSVSSGGSDEEESASEEEQRLL